jgi:hypothetical protein
MPRVADISCNALEIMMTLYNYGLMNHQMRALGLSPEQLAERAGISLPTAHAALVGQLGTLKKLRRVTDALKIRWEFITSDLPESEFHRAVLTNGSRRGRSVKPRPICGSANRPRRKELIT